MRSVNLLLPLRYRRLQSGLSFALLHQLTESAAAVNHVVSTISLYRALFSSLAAKCRSGKLIEGESVWIDYDTVVVSRAFDGNESAADFLGHTFGRACERVAKTTTTPGDPLQHVA